MAKEVSEEERKRIEEMIDSLVERAKKASEEYMKLDQEQVDEIVKANGNGWLRTSYGTC